ncbi:hypothetical protein ACTJIJ_26120 [Niabella sp. 22666]|uniref:hypothetical protein n=1 Tax=Niabella sp. 22666 TaxID=3453954 RepID=UPI003F8388B5
MKKMATQLALVACAMLLAGSASAQTDTTGRPIPDTVGRPIPDDTTRIPRDKKRHKKDKKMPKDSLKVNTPIAMLDAKWNSAFFMPVAYTSREFINTKDNYLKKEEHTTAS